MEVKSKLEKEVRRVFNKNFKSGPGYSYTCPALPKYSHQWLWDSCFAAIVLSKTDPDRAKKELETLLSAQKPNGFIPHIIKWPGGKTSNLTQPPIVALVLEEVYRNTKDRNFLNNLLPKVEKYFSWLEKERDPDGDGLVFIIHPWESTDASPSLIKTGNVVLGYWQLLTLLYTKSFKKYDILFNSIYAQGLCCLARLTKNKAYNQKAEKSEKAIFGLPYNGTASSLAPIILDNIPKEKINEIIGRLRNPDEFNLPFPVPFVAKNNPSFDPKYHGLLWRGPTWININWLIIRGLVKHGHKALAKRIAKKSIEMVEKQGLWEFYNPFTGKGEGQKDYSWSGLVLDLVNYL